MTNIQIQYFLEVAKYQNITHAAKARYVSQQVVSKQLRKLEEELGFQLFNRDKGALTLTEGGKLLYKFWASTAEEQQIVLEQARTIMKTQNETIRVGILEISRLYDWVAEAATNMDHSKHSYTILTETGSFLDLYRNLMEHKYDCIISIADENQNMSNDLTGEQFFTLWPKIILSDQHPCYHDGLTLDDLRDSDLFVLSSAFSKNAEKNILAYCEQYGFHPKKIRHFDSIASMELALHGRQGFTISYEAFLRNTTGHLKAVDIEQQDSYFPNYFHVAYQQKKKPVLEPFLEQLRNLNIKL